MTCGTAMIQQATRAARSGPSVTGRDRRPSGAVAFDGLEIVERHNPMGADAVEHGNEDDLRTWRAAATTAAPVIHGSVS